ncbi:hypothetical protein ON010_g13014 [Phytophthora cinnamomi]|nr:hypothetical protein ON010_g13014 [Phytophthora cinnamomi]
MGGAWAALARDGGGGSGGGGASLPEEESAGGRQQRALPLLRPSLQRGARWSEDWRGGRVAASSAADGQDAQARAHFRGVRLETAPHHPENHPADLQDRPSAHASVTCPAVCTREKSPGGG